MSKSSDGLEAPQQPADQPDTSNTIAALRLWPVVLCLAGMAATRFLPQLAEESMMMVVIKILGPVVFGLLILIWWLAFSRATKRERLIGLGGVLAAGIIVMLISHPTMLGPPTLMMTVPLGLAAFGIATLAFSRSSKRAWAAVLMAACGFAFTALLQNHGIWGHGRLDLQWRWESTNEERVVAMHKALDDETANKMVIPDTDFATWTVSPQWSRFRGNEGLGQQPFSTIDTNWEAKPPKELWRIPVGPGWSSFVVAGGALYTQEQRGEEETVACYSSETGDEIWHQQIETRFFDGLGGPGPRATPTLANGMLFAQGANGHLHRLDPRTGDVIWIVDLKNIADREPPAWGFSSSPLVIGSTVIAYSGMTAGKDQDGIFAFDVQTGNSKWSGPTGDHSYSSPQLSTLCGQSLVLMMTNAGVDGFDPESGEKRLAYESPMSGYRAIQPLVVENSIIIGTPDVGTQRVDLSFDGETFKATESWKTRNLKPDFNDFVHFANHIYGFDGTVFTCIDLADGSRKWKRGRYGKGQVLLLPATQNLLVLSEKGEVILLRADPSEHQELAKLEALEGRTWNHPVVVEDRLYIRNSREAACFELSLLTP